MKKKICFLMTDAISFNSLCRGQLEHFRDDGSVEMTLICGGDKADIDKLTLRNVGRVIDLGFVRKPSLGDDLVALVRLWLFLLVNRFDLVVYSTPKALLLGSLASFFSFQPSRIALIRGRVYENFRGKRRRVFQILDMISLITSQKALFISESLKAAYLQDGLVSGDKTRVLGCGSSNGLDVDKFSIRPQQGVLDDLRASFGFSYSDVIVVMVGRLCHDKGISDLSEIVNGVVNPALKFLVVGKIEDDASGAIISGLISNSGRVSYLGQRSDVASIFAIADIHLFLSHREGFGNVAIEAAAASVPTIAYDVVGVRDSVSIDISGVRVPFNDTKAVVCILEEAAQDLPRFVSRFNEASRWAAENFAQRTVWNRYLKFYLDACA